MSLPAMIDGSHFLRSLAALGLLALASVPTRADDPPEATRPVRVTVAPEMIELCTARDRQGIVVQAEYADGSTRDITAIASATVSPAVATVRDGIVAPKAEGRGTLSVAFEGLRSEAIVEVQRASEAGPLRFRNDVLPVLTKAGCNTGKCH